MRPEPRLAGGDNTSPSEIGLSLLGLLFAPSKVSFLCCEAFAVGPLCTADPRLRQTMPVGPISPVERQLGHGLAIGGKLQELLRGAHRRGVLFVSTVPHPMIHYAGLTRVTTYHSPPVSRRGAGPLKPRNGRMRRRGNQEYPARFLTWNILGYRVTSTDKING